MVYVVLFFVGVVLGALAVLLIGNLLNVRIRARETEAEALRQSASQRLEKIKLQEAELQVRANSLLASERDLRQQTQSYEQRVIAYGELQSENLLLKRDLQNIDVNLNKLQLDVELQAQTQRRLDERSEELGKYYLRDTVKAISSTLNPNNFAVCKDRLLAVIKRCREAGYFVTGEDEARFIDDLRKEFERVVRIAFEREEQARIRAQIREEEQLKREVDRELKQLEREQQAIKAALAEAMSKAVDQHSDEIRRLQERLTEAESKSIRAISMAQTTRAGNVYVISNIGSFGEGVFKVGMTRRLEPLDRIRELGDASVPFPFDVHMMIACKDAPALENALHRGLHQCRMNRTNPRKEFFRTEVETIVRIAQSHHGEVTYVATPEALEYRQSLEMPEADAEYIEQVYDAIAEVTEDQSVVKED